VLQIRHLKHDLDILGDGESLAIGKSEELVHIKHRVEILNPFRVYVAVEDDPLTLVQLPSHIVNDLPKNVGEQTIRPLPGIGVKDSVEVLLAQSLGVDHMRHPFNALQPLQGFEEHFPGSGLARPTRANHHEAVVEVGDLVELDHLLHPGPALLTIGPAQQLLLLADLDNLSLERLHLGPLVLDAWEDIVEQREEEGDVLGHQLWLHRLAHGLDENLLLVQVLGNLRLVETLPGVLHLCLDLVDSLSLDVARAGQH